MLSGHSRRTNRKVREIATAMVEGAGRTASRIRRNSRFQPRPETLRRETVVRDNLRCYA